MPRSVSHANAFANGPLTVRGQANCYTAVHVLGLVAFNSFNGTLFFIYLISLEVDEKMNSSFLKRIPYPFVFVWNSC